MKFNMKSKILLSCLVLCFLSIIFYIRYRNENKMLVSPLTPAEKILADWIKKEKQEEFWHPPTMPDNYHQDQIVIEAKSSLAINLTENKILFAKNANTVHAIASLTKIMTACLGLELASPETEMLVSENAVQDGEASMNLIAGEKLKMEELLYGLFLVSGNDAANVIAENIGGRKNTFVALMNEKAKILNLKQTEFYNPHGLDENNTPPNQSTAYELATLTYYALNHYPKIRQIVKTKEIVFPAETNHQEYHLVNVLGLEKTYPGMIGVKPGNTEKAGYCLIGLLKKNNQEILTVLLDSPNPKEEVKKLFNYSCSFL